MHDLKKTIKVKSLSTVSVDGADVFVPAGEGVYLEMWRLLCGEDRPVAGYCWTARAAVAVRCKVLTLANGWYIDDCAAASWAEDGRWPADVWLFLRDVLRFHLHEEKWTAFCLGAQEENILG